MNTVTGKEVKDAMICRGITRVDHHECAGCNFMTQYIREGESLYFNHGCYCGTLGNGWNLSPRDWESAADWINIQPHPAAANEIRRRFGLETFA